MVSKKSSLIIAAIVTIFSFTTITWLSCSKPGKSLNSCENYVCENGGYCSVDTVNQAYTPGCICPTGYEGANCATASVQKFLGTWDMVQTDTGSDSAASVGVVLKYTVNIYPTATSTTFFIGNLSNNPYYANILCTIDSVPNTSIFFLDTISATRMLYDHYQLLYGSGMISNGSMSGSFATRHLSPTSNWVHDTFTIVMTPHQF